MILVKLVLRVRLQMKYVCGRIKIAKDLTITYS